MPTTIKQEIREHKIRVYALIASKGKYLISKEEFGDKTFTKLPGGGIEIGETPIDCLKRELKEELGVAVMELELFHVTEVFVQNRFNPKQQVIGIYYKASINQVGLNKINKELVIPKQQGALRLLKRKWVEQKELYKELTFEMDKYAVTRLK